VGEDKQNEGELKRNESRQPSSQNCTKKSTIQFKCFTISSDTVKALSIL